MVLMGDLSKEALPASITFLVLFAVLVLLFFTIRSSRRTTFELDREYLRVRGDIFGGRYEMAALKVADAKLIDLNREPEYKPRIKVCGSSLPGYQSGWFNLKDKEKAWIYLTDTSRGTPGSGVFAHGSTASRRDANRGCTPARSGRFFVASRNGCRRLRIKGPRHGKSWKYSR
jgi:hypothetical protein